MRITVQNKNKLCYTHYSYTLPVFDTIDNDGDAIIPGSDISDVDSASSASGALSEDDAAADLEELAAECGLDQTIVAVPSESEEAPEAVKETSKCPEGFTEHRHVMTTRSRKMKMQGGSSNPITLSSDTEGGTGTLNISKGAQKQKRKGRPRGADHVPRPDGMVSSDSDFR